ncbi:glutathione S-transferase family protein [Methylomonas koyamae]|uniref:glutathione S-transferase family protein n=1 Tax=Methylomonas koyamae TaxID=702114 RepID=UPI001126BC88|nr:glutathione S-transferase [Methylomonas koyamae]TPQ24656.1 glutathione S-transferase [Methylomonas koyamae]
MITLYDMALSGNCHKVRLLLSLLGLPYQTRPVDLLGGEQRGSDFLQVNPFGQVPVLEDDGLTIRDSQAILVYLAKRYGGETWWPGDAYQLAQIAAWLSTAANEIFNGPAMLRVHHKVGRAIDTARAQQVADKVLGIVEGHLQNHDWLANDRLSLADLAVYPYLALAPEGGIAIGDYPNIVAWFQRIRALPGYVPMPGLWQA